MHIHPCINSCTHTNAHHKHKCTHTYAHIHTLVHIHANLHSNVHTHAHMDKLNHTQSWTFFLITLPCTCILMHTYNYTLTHMHTHTHPGMYTDACTLINTHSCTCTPLCTHSGARTRAHYSTLHTHTLMDTPRHTPSQALTLSRTPTQVTVLCVTSRVDRKYLPFVNVC